MSFPPFVGLQYGDQFKVRTAAQGPLYLPGTLGIDQNGDTYRYAQGGAAGIVIAKLYQAPIPVADHVLKTVAAAAVGATTIAMTLGATAVAANDYINGMVVVDLATNSGFGYGYHVDAHPGVALSGVFTIPLAGSPSRTLQSDGLALTGSESVQVAIATTATSVSLVPNPCKKVILSVAATPPTTAVAVGVGVAAVGINGWGWLKTSGECMCLTNGTVVIGQSVAPSATTAGAVEAVVATTAETNTVVGRVVRVAVTTAYSTIKLELF